LDQTAVARDDICAFQSLRRAREFFGVSILSSKVEAAQKRKNFAQRRVLTALQPSGEFKSGPLIKDEARPFTAGVCRRQDENAMHEKKYLAPTIVQQPWLAPASPIQCFDPDSATYSKL
jgi:hypothetical protein